MSSHISFKELKDLMMLTRFFPALSTIGFGDMVPRKGREPSSGIQTLELVIRALYIVVGLALVSSLLSAVVSAAEVIDRWSICRRIKCMYQGSMSFNPHVVLILFLFYILRIRYSVISIPRNQIQRTKFVVRFLSKESERFFKRSRIS